MCIEGYNRNSSRNIIEHEISNWAAMKTALISGDEHFQAANK
jgi:hypothetical protein